MAACGLGVATIKDVSVTKIIQMAIIIQQFKLELIQDGVI